MPTKKITKAKVAEVLEWLKERREGNFLREGIGFWNDKASVRQYIRECSKDLSLAKESVERIIDRVKIRELEAADATDESTVLVEQETNENPSTQAKPIETGRTTRARARTAETKTTDSGTIETRKEADGPTNKSRASAAAPTHQDEEQSPPGKSTEEAAKTDNSNGRKNGQNGDSESDEYYTPGDGEGGDDDEDDHNLDDDTDDTGDVQPQEERNAGENSKRKARTLLDNSSSDDSSDDEVDKTQSRTKSGARDKDNLSVAARKREALKNWNFSSSDDDDTDYYYDSDDKDEILNERKQTSRSSYAYNYQRSKNKAKVIRTTPRKKRRLSQKKKYEGRRKWSTEEVQAIQAGIRMYGIGHWAKIKERYDNVLSMRTSGQIKVNEWISVKGFLS